MFLRKHKTSHIDGIDQGVIEILSRLDERGYLKLKHLRLENDDTIQYVINSSIVGQIHLAANKVFCTLESLYLNKLTNLQQICRGKLQKNRS